MNYTCLYKYVDTHQYAEVLRLQGLVVNDIIERCKITIIVDTF